MDTNTGRPNHIEDYLITVRKGQWFGWTNPKNKIYLNLVVNDGGSKPSEADCTNGLKALQDSWDLENDSYRSRRRVKYPDLGEQLDLLYWDKKNGTNKWVESIDKIKSDVPKS